MDVIKNWRAQRSGAGLKIEGQDASDNRIKLTGITAIYAQAAAFGRDAAIVAASHDGKTYRLATYTA